MPDATLAQTLDDAADLGPYRRPQLERAAELVVDGDHHHRVAFAMRLVQGIVYLSGQRDTLQLHEASAADAHSVPVDTDRDAIADFVLGRVCQRQAEALVCCLLQNCQSDRVVEPALGCSGEPNNLDRPKTIGADHPPDFGPLARQCAGLVEEHGIDLAQQIESPSRQSVGITALSASCSPLCCEASL